MKRLVAAMLAVCVAAPAWAQAAPVIADIQKEAFQVLQRANGLKRSGTWTEDEVQPLRFAVTRDGKIDSTEQALLDALRKGSFEFTAKGQQSALFKPNDLSLKATLDPAAIALLTITEADLKDMTSPRPGESPGAFLVRRGNDGVEELTKLVQTDPKAREDARTQIAARFRASYVDGMKRGLQDAYSFLRNSVSTETSRGDKLPAADNAAWRAFVKEAAVLSSIKDDIRIELYAAAFGGPQQAIEQAPAIAAKLGLP